MLKLFNKFHKLIEKPKNRALVSGFTRVSIALFLGCLPIIYTPISGKIEKASAIANPDAISLPPVKTKIFQNVFRNGDTLLMSMYNVAYSVNATPTESPGEAFTYSIYDTDGTTLIQARPLVSATYGYNIIGIYFNETASENLTWGSPYIVRVGGSPIFGLLTEGVNVASVTLSSASWINGTYGAAENKAIIKEYGIGVASTIQTQWQQTLLALTTDGYVLNSLGRVTFLLAVPNLDYAVPGLFQTTYSNPDLTAETYTQDLQDEYSILGQLGTRTKDAFDGIGEYLGFSGEMLGALWAFLLILLVSSIAFLYSGNVTASIIIAIPMAFIGVITGIFPLYVFLLIIALIVIYSGYYLILRGM